ncbi:hypothetical protein MMC11_001997 [Xylographa trunciseda]|nr:hypothetical protein [Xylographa trunciseda]
MSDPQAGTTELDDQYQRTLTIHGREYQEYAINHATHFMPVDEEEADRLEAQHHVLNLVFDNRLIFPPLDAPKNVLDLGYGAASWAAEVAESYPDCEVWVPYDGKTALIR